MSWPATLRSPGSSQERSKSSRGSWLHYREDLGHPGRGPGGPVILQRDASDIVRLRRATGVRIDRLDDPLDGVVGALWTAVREDWRQALRGKFLAFLIEGFGDTIGVNDHAVIGPKSDRRLTEGDAFSHAQGQPAGRRNELAGAVAMDQQRRGMARIDVG